MRNNYSRNTCYSKLRNTWLSEDDHTQPYKINSYTDPTPTGLVVFDIDDTLRVVGDGKYANCQWRTTHKCGFPNNTVNDTQMRALKAINTFYDMGYDIAIYTREATKDLDGPSGALNYLKLLASKISDPSYKTKFTQDILVNYDSNIMFGTDTKYGNDKGKGLKTLADKLNIPHNKVVMFDDTNNNIKDIIDNNFCGITVSNTPTICGISDQNLTDGINFMKYGKCITPILNPSKGKGACAPH